MFLILYNIYIIFKNQKELCFILLMIILIKIYLINYIIIINILKIYKIEI